MTIIFTVSVFVIVALFVFFTIYERAQKKDISLFIQKNKLNYLKPNRFKENINTSYFSIGERIKNIVWGDYKGKRIYVFSVVFSANTVMLGALGTIESYTFLNGYFYKPLSVEDIESILDSSDMDNKKQTRMPLSEFKSGVDSDLIMTHFLIAKIYLDYGRLVEYKTCKEIYKILKKFVKIKQDKIYNKEEAINYIYQDKENKIESQIIKDIVDAHHEVVKTL